MQDLQITTPGPNNHYHVVYINSETGIAGMSQGSDGSSPHEIIYDPPRDPVEAVPPTLTDPTTGQQMEAPVGPDGQPDQAQIQEATQMGLQFDPGTPADPGKEVGTWVISPAGEDAHTHEGLTEYVVKVKKKKELDKDNIKDCLSLWREGLAITSDSREKGYESERFYQGKQWEDATRRGLNQLDRAALTINEIGPQLDALIGYQIEQRTDLRYLPQESGDQRVADMLNVVSKKILDACYYPREETKLFKDMCLPGFGTLILYVDHNDDIQGNIKVERFPWDDIVYGPHEKEDLSDCEFEVRSRMYSIAKLKQLFGSKAKDIEESFAMYGGQYPNIDKLPDNGVSGTNTDYRLAKKIDDVPFTVDGSFPLVDVQKKQFRLAQCTRKTYVEVTVIFNAEENFFFTAYDWEQEDIAAASTIPGFQVISQMKTRMRVTKFCGNVVLSDENPADLPMHDFYTVPAYAYRQNGEYWGKVEWAKDPQRELNKRRSQAMDTMNRLGAQVYYTTPETFVDKNEKEKFKKNRSKPGSMFEINEMANKPYLEEGADFPAALVQIMQLDQENLQRLINSTARQGGANESGAMFLEKKKANLTNNQFLFDNLSFAKQRLGKLLLSLIQRYYSPERLYRLLNSQYSKTKFNVGGEDFSQFSKDEIIEMLSEADLLEYDVIVTESSFSPSTRLAVAQVLFDLIAKGAQIPPELALEFVDMPDDVRMRINGQLQQQQEAASQSATDTSNTEIKKTAIATGQYTISPEEAQGMGLIPVGQNQPLANTAETNNNETDTQADEYANNLASTLAG
jgi:hypothetical protein